MSFQTNCSIVVVSTALTFQWVQRRWEMVLSFPAWCQGILTGVEIQGHNLLQPLRSPWGSIYSEEDIHHSDPALFPADAVFLLYWAHSALSVQFNNNQHLLNPYLLHARQWALYMLVHLSLTAPPMKLVILFAPLYRLIEAQRSSSTCPRSHS